MTRRETPLDAASILQVLARHGVEYILIGGLAVQAHGHIRTTQDVDIFPSPDPENLERLALALGDLGAHPADRPTGSTPSARELGAASTHVLETEAGGLDVHLTPAGAASWAELRRRALVLDVVDTRVAVAGLDDLIALKRATGRPIDRSDVLALARHADG
jgi:predicted nucleotidyltransferase